MSDLALRFARAHRALRTIAVTGTNGKTTTTSMIEAIVAASGEPSARLTTLGASVAGELVETESASDEFLLAVERAVQAGVRTFALEVTSKALAFGFAQRWPPNIAVFTNLSHDHLEAHGSAEAYLASKAQLFMVLGETGTAVLNRDDPASAMIDEVTPASVRRLGYSLRDRDADLAALRVEARVDGTTLTLAPSPLANVLGDTLELRAPGDVHAQNALAAALATHAAGYNAESIRAGLASFLGVPGRFEIIARAPLVVVDYAHTPDGLEGTLQTARALTADHAALVCVFGCGGGRDRAKRPAMGEIAARLADRVIVTTDNPRFEDAGAIAASIVDGARQGSGTTEVVLDRRDAITLAISEASDRDVVVIAGKGHEAVQEIAGVARPFSDAAVVRDALRARAIR